MKISARYLLIEAAMGVLAVALFLDFAGHPLDAGAIMGLGTSLGPFVAYLMFVAALVAIAFIDLDHFIIPDVITLPGTVIGVCVSFLAGHAIGIGATDGLIGAVAGAGFIILIIVGYGALTGRQGMGGGDWKLMAFIGAFLGWQALPFVMLAGSVQGLVFAVAFRRAFAVEELPPDPMEASPKAAGTSQDTAASATEASGSKPFSQLAVPFGPFLSVAAIEFLLFRVEITGWMANLVDPL
jgi:prepilin signal peptidase PulO-like enzyme (type II secretory pathway)